MLQYMLTCYKEHNYNDYDDYFESTLVHDATASLVAHVQLVPLLLVHCKIILGKICMVIKATEN